MLSMIMPVMVGALLGAGLGYFGQCSSGTCPLTSTWWRGALYGAALGGIFAFGSNRSSGSSGAKVDSTNLVHLAQSEFDARVLHSERPVLVDFYAPWCGPCKTLSPTIAKLADDYVDRVKVAKVNVDEAPQLSERYRVEGIPTLLFISGGKVVDSVVGLASEKELRAKLEKLTITSVTLPQSKPSS
jgi:thioredoxin 1